MLDAFMKTEANSEESRTENFMINGNGSHYVRNVTVAIKSGLFLNMFFFKTGFEIYSYYKNVCIKINKNTFRNS